MYNKLFAKILDSSIWLEPHETVRVWITFIAAMDEDGFVAFASPANVAHRARVTLPEAETALAKLAAPDANSSDPDNEGRRIERVPGGWIVLNAPKYREMATRENIRATTRERVRKHRSKAVSTTNSASSNDTERYESVTRPYGAGNDTSVTNALPDGSSNAPVTPSEAEADTEAKSEREREDLPRALDATAVDPRTAELVRTGVVSRSSAEIGIYTRAENDARALAGVVLPPAAPLQRRPRTGVEADVNEHRNCFGSGTLPSCARGVCVRAYLVDGWRRQLKSDASIESPDAYICAFIADTVRKASPGPLGDALKFWSRAWDGAHAAAVVRPGQTKSDRTREAARRVLGVGAQS
jgi:hypothetical protein